MSEQNHYVENVQDLINDSKDLLLKYTNGVGGEDSASGLLEEMGKAIDNLETYWGGMDAGVQIQKVVQVYNEIIGFRDKMSKTALMSFAIAKDYRKKQALIGAPVSVPEDLNDDKNFLPKEEYKDERDTVDIKRQAIQGKVALGRAKEILDNLETTFANSKNKILNNWQQGDGREEVSGYFDDFAKKIPEYREVLNTTYDSVSNALKIYGYE